ncbi:MAG: glycosyltransferase [Actinomycetota bacterium]|nr:glycosyltransferase [Actinomycetota bacterium]
MTSVPLISVCVLSGRRIALLEACLDSLQKQQDPPPFELLVGADRDGSVRSTALGRFPEATVIIVDGKPLGAARNMLVNEARGELLLFIDDDVVIDPRMLRRLRDLHLAHPEAMVFGGPNETPRGSSNFQVVQGAVLASLVGSGPVRRRYGPHPAGSADERWFILCNLAVHRRAMLSFPEDLVGGEENAVLAEMSRRGLRMHYDPSLLVYHQRRSTLGGFGRQMHKYGVGRGAVLRRQPLEARLPYLVPSALLAYLVALPGLTLLDTTWLLPLVAYFGVVAAGALKVAFSVGRIGAAPLALVLFVTMHVCYGAGVLTGIFVRSPRTSPRQRRSRGGVHAGS